MQRFYKLRHRPTGLFYKPDSSRSQLHSEGKVYAKKPTARSIGVYDEDTGGIIPLQDWEVVAYEAREVEVFGYG